jgi:hypothetical protein
LRCATVWIAEAQLLSKLADRAHLSRILEGILDAYLRIQWSGYLRVHEIDAPLASLMVRSGLFALEVPINSDSQRIVDASRLNFSVKETIGGLERLTAAGYAGSVLLNLSLNAPGEAVQTLRETFALVERVTGIFGARSVMPVGFFLSIQSHAGLERAALAEGHIHPGYNTLSASPLRISRLTYNPSPPGRLIGRACVEAYSGVEENRGIRILASLELQVNAQA